MEIFWIQLLIVVPMFSAFTDDKTFRRIVLGKIFHKIKNTKLVESKNGRWNENENENKKRKQW